MVIGEYTPPAAKAPCCAGCASPAERRALQRVGAGMVADVAGGRRRPGLRGEEISGGILTPGNIKNNADQTNSEVWALARDYSKAIATGAINHAQLASFKDYFNEWGKFYGSLDSWYGSIPFVGPLTWAGTYDRIQEYRSRLVAWRNLLVRAGGATSSPAPVLPPKDDGGSNMIKWVAGAAIVVGGAYALGKVAGFIPKFRSA